MRSLSPRSMAARTISVVTTILLARHGESDWNVEQRWQGHADRPLTDRGRAQAEELARRLAQTQEVSPRPRRGPIVLRSLAVSAREVLAAYRATVVAAGAQQPISSTAEWLLDNFHIVEEQLAEVERMLAFLDAQGVEAAPGQRRPAGDAFGQRGRAPALWAHRVTPATPGDPMSEAAASVIPNR